MPGLPAIALMSPGERLDEVAQILAVGLARLKARESTKIRLFSSHLAENSLDCAGQESVHPTVSTDGEVANAR
jgi:hypothetical protein